MLDCADSSFSSLIFLFWVFIWSVFKLNAMKICIFVQMISLLLKQGPLRWDKCHKIKINFKCQLFTLLIIVGFGLLRCWNFSSEKQKMSEHHKWEQNMKQQFLFLSFSSWINFTKLFSLTFGHGMRDSSSPLVAVGAVHAERDLWWKAWQRHC